MKSDPKCARCHHGRSYHEGVEVLEGCGKIGCQCGQYVPRDAVPAAPASSGTPEPDASPFRSRSCGGERCLRCGAPADGKIEEVIFDDDPQPMRHPLTAYLCRAHLRETLMARQAARSSGTGDAPPLTAEILAAIAKVDADCGRLSPRQSLATIDEILASTPEQGTDLPQAMLTAMFGDGYQLSHERRLLAITVARALPALIASRSALAAAERERDEYRLRAEWAERSAHTRGQQVAVSAAALAEARTVLDAIWKYCRVIYYPSLAGEYPIEHYRRANVDRRQAIESRLAMVARATPPEGETT